MRIGTRFVVRLALAAATSGCGTSAIAHFYTLDALAVADGTPSARYAVAVGPVTVPAAVDRPQMVVHVSANRVELDEFNRWAGPLEDGIASAVAQNLSVLLGTPNVVTGSIPGIDPAYRVRIDVQRFESTPGKDVLLDAAWAVFVAAGGPPRSGRSLVREPASEQGIDGVAAAHSRALAAMSVEIASAIRGQAARTR